MGKKNKKGLTKAVGKTVSNPSYFIGIVWVCIHVTYLTVFFGFQTTIVSNKVFNLIMTLGGQSDYVSTVTAGFVIGLILMTLDMLGIIRLVPRP